MNEPALTYIAESIVKAVGVAGVEAMAMKKSITMLWNPVATEFSEELVSAIIVGDQVRPERAENIMTSYRLRFADFVEAAAPYVNEYVGLAYDRGREYTLSDAISGVLDLELFKVKKSDRPEQPIMEVAGPFHDYYYGEGVTSSRIADRLWQRYEWQREGEFVKVKKDQTSIISELVSLTGSTKKNVQRTITRWFKETQGQYFERFVVPETARLMSYAGEAEGNITTLRKIGQDYKKFVEADAYWSSVSEFNSESSKVWAQVQTLHEVGVTQYTIIAVLDRKTCAVCSHLHGTTWSVQDAVNKIYDMLIMESEEAYQRNPFPPRSTPKDFEDPQESPYTLPPFHPRCRCNVRSEHQITQMPGDVVARPFDSKKPPTDKSLTRVFNTYINKLTKKEVEAALKTGDKYIPDGARALTGKEWKRVKEGFEDIPYEIRKWSERNRGNYRVVITDAEGFSSRVYGNTIVFNSKYVADDVGTHVIQHELRHALVNKPIMQVKGGGDTIWNDITGRKFRNPVHINRQYSLNGGRGLVAAEAAADEFMAMIGDYYNPGMNFEDLVKAVRAKKTGIEIATKPGQITVAKTATYWSAKEAKEAVTYWWSMMDIDDLTLLSKKQMMAKLTHLPMSSAKLHIATQNELRLRDLLRKAGVAEVFQEGDRKPFDVWIGADPVTWYEKLPGKKKPTIMVEVKSIIEAKNSKITMHDDSLFRKKKEWTKMGKRKTQVYTVVFDERTGKLYYKQGVGSFRLSAMTEATEGDLQILFGGKATETITEAAPAARAIRPASYTSWAKARSTAAKFLESNDYDEVVREYTGSTFAPINRLLRKSSTLAKAIDNPKWGLDIEVLADALNDAPSYRGKTYRAMWFDKKADFGKFSKEVNKAIDNTDDLLFKGFTSATNTKDGAYRFLGAPDKYGVLVEMKSVSGTVIEGISGAGSEQEILFNAFSRFKVKGFKQVPHPAIKGKKIWVLQLEEKARDYITEAAPAAERLARTTPASSLKVKGTIDQGNVNEVQIVTIGKGKKKYIFKPIKGESYYNNEFAYLVEDIKEEFGVIITHVDDLTDEMWDFLDLDVGEILQSEYLMRGSITNTNIPLASREAFALDVGHKLGFNNDYALIPNYTMAVDDSGETVGILMEFISKAEDHLSFTGRKLSSEESLQMAVFDYLIGNTDRHEGNWMRKYTKKKPTGVTLRDPTAPAGQRNIPEIVLEGDGRPVYIDHGYVMPGQDIDTGGLYEIRMQQVLDDRIVYSGMEYDMDQEWIQAMAIRVQKFVDEEATDLAKRYGFDSSEIDAMLRRGDSVAERLRGGTFGALLEDHREKFGTWGLEDSYIGG